MQRLSDISQRDLNHQREGFDRLAAEEKYRPDIYPPQLQLPLCEAVLTLDEPQGRGPPLA